MSPLAQRVVSQEEDDIEIWHYMELGEQEATRSLFVKSILRTTTSRWISRNFLYPGFFDKAVRLRLDPPHVKVALISEVPLTTMFATILEHKSVSRLDIIRTDENIQDLSLFFQPTQWAKMFSANFSPKVTNLDSPAPVRVAGCKATNLVTLLES